MHALVECQSDTISIGPDIKMSRDTVSSMIVGLDCLVMLIFSISIIRLRWYEEESIKDMKIGKLKVEDFTVTIPYIPLSKSHYNNSPEILKAQLAVHFESVLKNQPQCIESLEDIQDHES